MPQIQANGVAIEYEAYGDPANPALLLVMGLGAQLTLWPMELVDALVARGYHVIRHDNRDIGLSQKFEEGGSPDMQAVVMAVMSGQEPPIAYRLTDMAADAAALLDALGIDRAHVVGASMGGMIVQLMGIHHADRLHTITSIMSTTGNPALPPARPEAMAVLMERPPADATLDQVKDLGVRVARGIGSPAYPAAVDKLHERIERDYRRAFYPAGAPRQFAAIVADGDRRERLKAVTTPTLVIHGVDDPLVPVEGGRDTAASIAGARLLEIPGMGHDLPVELVEQIAEAIAGHAR